MIPNQKFSVISVDPPWRFSSRGIIGGKFTGLETVYPTMSIQDLKDLKVNDIPIKGLADKDCALFMWATSAHLPDAIDIMKTWGFIYSRIDSVWSKKTINGKRALNVGPWGLNDCELLLMSYRGRMLKHQKVNNLSQCVEAVRPLRHSQKPEIFRQRIEQRFGDLPRIELFARQEIPGWVCWGNEVSKIDLKGNDHVD